MEESKGMILFLFHHCYDLSDHARAVWVHKRQHQKAAHACALQATCFCIRVIDQVGNNNH